MDPLAPPLDFLLAGGLFLEFAAGRIRCGIVNEIIDRQTMGVVNIDI